MVNFGKKKGEMVKEETAMVKTDAQLPDFIKPGDTRGTEHMTREDIQMPRLSLAQGLSPQITEGDPTYIEGLKIGDMFNSITGENYGRGPLEFTVVRADSPRGVEFVPRNEGGGIRDFNVPLNDPRMQFVDGKTPEATKFYDFIILRLPELEVLVVSFKSMSLKVAKQLNALMKLRRCPIFGGKYILTSAMSTNPKGTFAMQHVQNAGFVDDKETYDFAEETFKAVMYKELLVPDDTVDDDIGDDKPPF